jgi:peptidoglycan biosynthesis protein MviN/MurJ (putative lipid II flippase)
MLTFFDYLYYSLRKFYSRNNKESAGFSALAVITITQTLNVLALYDLYGLMTRTKLNISKLIVLVLYFSVIILNVLRYSKLDPDIIKEKWENKKENQKIILRTSFFLYVVLSFVVELALTIYGWQ